MIPNLTPPWHTLPVDDVLRHLAARPAGMSALEAQERLVRFGPNRLRQGKPVSFLLILLRQLHHPLTYILFASGFLALLMGRLTDGVVVLAVIVINSFIGLFQEYRAAKVIQALSSLVPEYGTVLRDGEKVHCLADEIVPGDIVLLEAGERVAADMRLFAAHGLFVDESLLTGESLPVEKQTDTLSDPCPLAERSNLALKGTLVVAGNGRGVVIGTGRATEIGAISGLIGEATEVQTPLVQRLEKATLFISLTICGFALLLFGIALARSYPLVDASIAAISLAVGAIPEGLPAIVTIVMAVGAKRMAERQAVVRHLPAIETLGSTTVVCTDKTGTLTLNQMTVKQAATERGLYAFTGQGYQPKGQIECEGRALASLPEDLGRLLQACVLCNDSYLSHEGASWKIHGDPTEAALIVAAAKAGLPFNELRQSRARLAHLPFDSKVRYMATLHREGEAQTIYLKGSPEAVFTRCRHAERMTGLTESFAANGLRVLAIAQKEVTSPLVELNNAAVQEGFELLGLIAMMDPPRPEAKASIRACQEAGIVVKMITGDHPLTAQAIGRELGIANVDTVLTGLENLSEQEWAGRVNRCNLFARVTPEHKFHIVKTLQAGKQVVTMTGDGVNDAPALKQADIGVAMGVGGTSVAKEASDLVLLDDRFSSIEAAVEEGRRVYANIVKSIAFILPTNLALAFILLAAIAFFPFVDGQPLLPLFPTQILWINLVSAVCLSLPLAFEPIEPGAMTAPPRAKKAPIFSRFIWYRTLWISLLNAGWVIALFLWEYPYYLKQGIASHEAVAMAQTTSVTAVIFFQIVYLVHCRTLRASPFAVGFFSNPWIFVGVATILLLQALYIWAPLFNGIFRSTPIGGFSLLSALLAAACVLPVISLEKGYAVLKKAKSRR